MSWQTYPDLKRALAAHRIPLENRPLIERLCLRVGIESYEGNPDGPSHIRANRTSGGPPLLINWGWTEGFIDENEARDASEGRAPTTASDFLDSGNVYVEHPTNRLHMGGGGQAGPRRARATTFCPHHHTALPATGICDECS